MGYAYMESTQGLRPLRDNPLSKTVTREQQADEAAKKVSSLMKKLSISFTVVGLAGVAAIFASPFISILAGVMAITVFESINIATALAIFSSASIGTAAACGLKILLNKNNTSRLEDSDLSDDDVSDPDCLGGTAVEGDSSLGLHYVERRLKRSASFSLESSAVGVEAHRRMSFSGKAAEGYDVATILSGVQALHGQRHEEQLEQEAAELVQRKSDEGDAEAARLLQGQDDGYHFED